MVITKRQVLELVKDLPDEIDIDELMYRLYLRQKLEAAEKDVREGLLVSHEEVIKEIRSDTDRKHSKCRLKSCQFSVNGP